MFNKIKFNNLFVSKKKIIQQGRIQTINRLVQKVRKLKAALEKRPNNEKSKERLRKSIENIEQLKQLKRVEIIKRLLILNKNPSTIITNGRATPAEIAIALLATNKVLQDIIKLFRRELNLNEADETWKDELMQTSTKVIKKKKTEEKRRKRRELKEQKATERKRYEWLRENVTSEVEKLEASKLENENEYKEDEFLSTSGIWKVETVSTNRIIDKVKESRPKSSNQIELNHNIKKSKNNEQSDEFHIKHSKTVHKQDTKFSERHSHEEQTLSTHNAENEVETVDAELTHVVDPFFITETGENYLSTAVINKQQHTNAEHAEAALMPKPAFNDFRKTRQIKNVRNEKPHSRNTNNSNKKLIRSCDNSTRLSNFNNETTEVNKLHPSWAAKQKMKAVASVFKGKKTTFGDNDNDDATRSKITNPITVDKHRATKVAELNDLHPSWAAKQKLKPTITGFQGKKIIFGDDDD